MKLLISITLFSILIISACSALKLEPANFAWPIESVLEVDDEGFVKEERYIIEFNTKELFFEEFQDSSFYMDKSIRMIRNYKGYYFITAKEFKNVYVFSVDDGKLILDEKILIDELRLTDPAFNQRNPYIELLDGENKYRLLKDGIADYPDENN